MSWRVTCHVIVSLFFSKRQAGPTPSHPTSRSHFYWPYWTLVGIGHQKLGPICSEILSPGPSGCHQMVIWDSSQSFLNFCNMYSLTDLLPVLEVILGYHAAFLGNQGPCTLHNLLIFVSITYISSAIGFADPRDHTSHLHLRLVITV